MKRLWPLGVGIAGVVAGIVTLAPSQWGLGLSVAALVVGFGMFGRDVVLARREWSRLQCVAVVSPFPAEVKRGAKPEFFAVTRLKISARDVAAAKISAGEKLYTERVSTIFVDLGQLRQELDDGHQIEQAPSCPPVIRDSGSLPLLTGLRAAALIGQTRTAGRP